MPLVIIPGLFVAYKRAASIIKYHKMPMYLDHNIAFPIATCYEPLRTHGSK